MLACLNHFSYQEEIEAHKTIDQFISTAHPEDNQPGSSNGKLIEEPNLQNSMQLKDQILPNVLPDSNRTSWDTKTQSTIIDFKKLAVVQSDYDNSGFSGRK